MKCRIIRRLVASRHVDPGAPGQLSQLYPGLTVVAAWETRENALHHLVIQNGEQL